MFAGTLTDKILLGMPANYHLMALQEFSLMPVANLLTVDADSPYHTEDNRATIFYAQSWALTHYLLMGDQASHRPRLSAFLEALDEGASAGDAAKKAFGDLELLNRTLREYVSRHRFAALIAALERALALNPDLARASALLGYLGLRASGFGLRA